VWVSTNKATTDQIFCIRQILEKKWEYNETLHQLFIDFKNTDKSNYMLLSRHPNAGQNHNINIASRSFENVAPFKYLGTTVINQD
jgi:hypothetical protein